MGAVILPLMALYLLILILATRYGYRWAVKRGWTGKKRWLGAMYGFLIIYLPVFWDFIPTIITHQYYCATEAGFWVYKTTDQWAQENPSVIDTLVRGNEPLPNKHKGGRNSWETTYELNQRVINIWKHNGPFPLYNWRTEAEWIDTKNNKVLARSVDFYTSYERRQAGWSGWKFWLRSDHCPGYKKQVITFSKTIEPYSG